MMKLIKKWIRKRYTTQTPEHQNEKLQNFDRLIDGAWKSTNGTRLGNEDWRIRKINSSTIDIRNVLSGAHWRGILIDRDATTLGGHTTKYRRLDKYEDEENIKHIKWITAIGAWLLNRK